MQLENNSTAYARSVLRIVVGLLFTMHGCQKLFGLFGGMFGRGPSPMWSQSWVAGLIETVGGGLIFFGLFTRPVAFLLCGEMAVAYFQKHIPRGFWPLQNAGEVAVLYCFIFLYLTAAGAGPLSLDQSVRRKR
jgi:putative oxidoreductase